MSLEKLFSRNILNASGRQKKMGFEVCDGKENAFIIEIAT